MTVPVGSESQLVVEQKRVRLRALVKCSVQQVQGVLKDRDFP